MPNARIYKDSKRTSIYMDADVLKRLTALAAKRNESLSQMVNGILQDYLTNR
jgi:predicted transcriptional regulator